MIDAANEMKCIISCEINPTFHFYSLIMTILHHGFYLLASACSTANGGCSHICSPTPSGPRCSCHQHYLLQQDHKTCRKVNTCHQSYLILPFATSIKSASCVSLYIYILEIHMKNQAIYFHHPWYLFLGEDIKAFTCVVR